MKKRTLGLAMCGSFCTFSRVLDAFETLDQELYELSRFQIFFPS